MLVCFAKRCMKFIFREFSEGDASFTANVLGARGALLSVLVHFFEQGRWGSPVETAVAGQCLSAEDQLFILMQAGLVSNGNARVFRTGGANLLPAR